MKNPKTKQISETIFERQAAIPVAVPVIHLKGGLR